MESVWKPEAHGGGRTVHYEAGVLALSVEALANEAAALETEAATLETAGVEEVSLIAALFFNYSLIYALFFKLSLAFVWIN